MKTFINFRLTTPLHYAKERWCDYLKPHSKLNTRDKKEAENIMMEVALGFITATLDMDKPLTELRIELQNKMIYSYMFARNEVEKFKAGNTENVVSESRREE